MNTEDPGIIGEQKKFRKWHDSVIVLDSVESVGSGAFLGCTSLGSITLPDSVRSIGEEVFGNCSSLKSVSVPDSVEDIQEDTFDERTIVIRGTDPGAPQ